MEEADLAGRISRLEDIEAIRALSSRYAVAVDTRDYAELRDLFTNEATFGGTSDGAAGVTGGDKIVAFMRDRLERDDATYHCVHDALIRIDPAQPDRASGIVTTHAETRNGTRSAVKAVRYNDQYRRIAGNWTFQARMLSFPLE